MTIEFEEYRSALSTLISTALGEFRTGNDDEMEMFAVDCHPWNGVVVLAFLTHAELRDAPFLSEAAEMAAWKYYDFGAVLACWRSASELGSRMRAAYEEAGAARSTVARRYFQACAEAVASKQVQDVLFTYHLAEGFKITITHPDSGEEFYPPEHLRRRK
jgi:hypothetical protein